MSIKYISKFPVFGPLVVILNSYVWGGNFNSDDEFAPFGRWIKVLCPAILISIALTCLVTWPVIKSLYICGAFDVNILSGVLKSPGDIAVDILPSILGFGIGAYALIFVLSKNLISNFQKTAAATSGATALAINADMAFPLFVMVIAISIGIVQKVFALNVYLLFSSWFFLWYSLMLSLCLIASLFSLGEVSILEKIEG